MTPPSLRPPSLWRAVCFVAEHTFVDELWPHAGAHWNVPRPLVRIAQQSLAERRGRWEELSGRFLAGTDERARLGALIDGLDKAGGLLLLATGHKAGVADLARAAGITHGAAHRSLRLLARHFLIGPAFLRAAMTAFRLPPARITAAPFVPLRSRWRVTASEDDIGAYLYAFAGQPLEVPNPVPLALVQLSALLHDPWVIIRSIPGELLHSEERLRASCYGPVVDQMIAQAERRCGEVERLLAQAAPDAAAAEAVAARVAERWALLPNDSC